MARLLVNYSANYHDNIDVMETYEEILKLLQETKASHIEVTMYGGRKTFFSRERIITGNESPIHELTAAEQDVQENVLVKNTGTGQQLSKLNAPQTPMI